MATLKTIKTDGSGDYTTLQAYLDWVITQAGDQEAECYGDDIGGVSKTGAFSCDSVSIYANSAHKQDGTITVNSVYAGSRIFIKDFRMPITFTDLRITKVAIGHANATELMEVLLSINAYFMEKLLLMVRFHKE